ncbi:MAG: hypothetical protein EOO01_00200 [Chitinophagaceae bacterium]|nr:MAG: hypothetical protein EOO01_00200 [Chitinophagaceae bacterium]
MFKVVSKIFKINALQVIGIIKKDDFEEYYVLTVRRRNDKIQLTTKASYATFEDLMRHVSVKLPVVLLVEGKGVLNKEVDFTKEADINWYKNIDFNSICYTSIKGLKSTFMSFCRKGLVSDTKVLFEQNGFQVVDLYVGSLLSSLLYPSVNIDTIVSGDLALGFTAGKLSAVNRADAPHHNIQYQVGEDSIPGSFMALYGAVVDFFVNSGDVSRSDLLSLNKEEVVYKKAFERTGVTILVVFFVTLLTSYFLIQYYGTQNVAYNLQKVYSAQSYQATLDLEKQRDQKKKLLAESGFLSKNFMSYYAYEIIRGIPSDIVLDRLAVSPPSKEIKVNSKLLLDHGHIMLKGETFDESSFNNWIQDLKQMKWLKHFEINSLKKNKQNKAVFDVTITVKDV